MFGDNNLDEARSSDYFTSNFKAYLSGDLRDEVKLLPRGCHRSDDLIVCGVYKKGGAVMQFDTCSRLSIPSQNSAGS
jgi:hypothetical protein